MSGLHAKKPDAEVTIQDLGDATLFRVIGRLTFLYADRLQIAILSRPGMRLAVVDMAEVTAIDAAGSGILVSVRNWCQTNSVALKLMNLSPETESLLELTALKTVFEICSVPEMLDLWCRALHHDIRSANGASTRRSNSSHFVRLDSVNQPAA